jgi:uncharacterized protein YceH (UPF0502 family)
MSELDLLPENVRAAYQHVYRDATKCMDGYSLTLCAELLRLAKDCAEHATWRDINEQARFQAQQRAERAESELAALRTRIADAPVLEGNAQ